MAMYLGAWDGYVPMKSIITGFRVHNSSGPMFMHSLRDFISIYTFGERISPISISGVSFAHVCERSDERINIPTTGQSLFFPNYHGLEYVMSYYDVWRVSSFGAPVTIVLGISTVLYGFLTDLDISLQDASQQVCNFTLEFKGTSQTTILEIIENNAATILIDNPGNLNIPFDDGEGEDGFIQNPPAPPPGIIQNPPAPPPDIIQNPGS